MGHKYIKEEDTFSTSQNGTVPKPTAQEVSDNKFLRADGSWAAGAGGSTVSADQIISSGTEIGGVTIDGNRTAFYAPLPKHNYSTSEQVVGKWIDGKPLYEKTFQFSPSSTSYTVNIGALNIDFVVKCVGTVKNTAGNFAPLPYYTGSGDFAVAYVAKDVIPHKLKISYAGTHNQSVPWTVILQYTKTTDSV